MKSSNLAPVSPLFSRLLFLAFEQRDNPSLPVALPATNPYYIQGQDLSLNTIQLYLPIHTIKKENKKCTHAM